MHKDTGLLSDKLKKHYFSKSYATRFVFFLFSSLAIYVLAAAIFDFLALNTAFYYRTKDFCMDFFNSIRDAAQGLDAYAIRHIIYPPLANLFFVALSKISPDAYNNTEFFGDSYVEGEFNSAERYEWQNYPELRTMIFVVSFVFVALFATLIFFGLHKLPRGKRIAVTAAMTVSLPILYMLERGNIIFLALIALLVYAFTYNSESRVLREIGILCLALSFALKIYTILFAWFLFTDKRYKDFIRCAIYCVILLIVPALFLDGGLECFVHLLRNIFSFTKQSGGASAEEYDPRKTLLFAFSLVMFLVFAANYALAPYLKLEKWKQWAIGALLFITFPPLTSIYAWSFLLIPLIFIFNDDCRGTELGLYFFPLLIPFLFLPVALPWEQVAFNTPLVYICSLILAVLVTCDTVRALRKVLAEKKTKTTDIQDA